VATGGEAVNLDPLNQTEAPEEIRAALFDPAEVIHPKSVYACVQWIERLRAERDALRAALVAARADAERLAESLQFANFDFAPGLGYAEEAAEAQRAHGRLIMKAKP
jgi:hypothetical protein